MSTALGLTSQQTPLSWPTSLDLSSVSVTNTSGIKISTPRAGSLQILTRRQGGGVGDGVNIEEDHSISADYRGQLYNYDEAILHVPGLHVFPGQSSPYAGEYHIHMETIHPKRFLTLVIPIKQIVAGVRDVNGRDISGNPYFSACKARPDASAVRPNLSSILPFDSDIIQYVGPEIRGRTSTRGVGSTTYEHAYLLVLTPIYIRAFDLERIPREGSASSDPRDLPAPGVVPTVKIEPSVLQKKVKFSPRGLINPNPYIPTAPVCPAPIPKEIPEPEPVIRYGGPGFYFGISILFTVGFYFGVMIMDWILNFLFWQTFFTGARVTSWEPLKAFYITAIVISCILWYGEALVYFGL
jgi:hypothetical protein